MESLVQEWRMDWLKKLKVYPTEFNWTYSKFHVRETLFYFLFDPYPFSTQPVYRLISRELVENQTTPRKQKKNLWIILTTVFLS